MTKTISFDLSKRLDELWLLRDVETEYYITDYWEIYYANEIDIINTNDINSVMYWEWKSYWKFSDKIHPPCLTANKHYDLIFKTMTTDEAFEFIWKQICHFEMPYPNAWILNWWTVHWDKIEANNLCEYFEKCITYLLDKNLIWHTKIN